jgi:hypothetical protein
MNERSRALLLWSPRILAVLVCLFLSLFAADVVGNGKTLSGALPDVAIHLLPVLVLLAVVAVSWRLQWVGGLVFTGVAAWYAYFARGHVSWILCISVPLLIVGVLYIWSWRGQRGASELIPFRR